MPIRREDNPLLYFLNVERHRFVRSFSERFSGKKFAGHRSDVTTSARVAVHKSLLLRTLAGTDMRLQVNKVTNLRLGAATVDGLVIMPGETFSLWRAIGRASAGRGYLSGMLLADGKVKEGVGGGLCQLANLLYWLALHSPLTVAERHHHSLDFFPDSGRVLPFGSGASIFFNYIDLQLRNDTPYTFKLRTWVDEKFLRGEIFSDALPPFAYHIEERGHHFYRNNTGDWRRENWLYQISRARSSGAVIEEKLIAHNDAKVLYPMPGNIVAST